MTAGLESMKIHQSSSKFNRQVALNALVITLLRRPNIMLAVELAANEVRLATGVAVRQAFMLGDDYID